MKPAAPARLLAAIVGLATATLAHAAFPERPIRLVVPYAAGGGTDGVSRAFAEGLARELKQPVVVENRPGAGAIIGTQAVASAPRDGYTILLASNGNMVLTPILYKDLRFDARKDLKVFAMVAEAPTVVVTGAAVPANTLREFEAYAKANAGRVFYGLLGQGNALFIATKVMETMMGIQMTGIQYKGSSPALLATMAGEVQVYVDLASTSVPLIKGGKIKALAVPNRARLEALPDVPTFAEAGYPEFHAASWVGFALPSGTPDAVVRTLHAAARKVIADEKFRETAKALGMVMLPEMSESAIGEFMEADYTRWSGLARRFNITIEQ